MPRIKNLKILLDEDIYFDNRYELYIKVRTSDDNVFQSTTFIPKSIESELIQNYLSTVLKSVFRELKISNTNSCRHEFE